MFYGGEFVVTHCEDVVQGNKIGCLRKREEEKDGMPRRQEADVKDGGQDRSGPDDRNRSIDVIVRWVP